MKKTQTTIVTALIAISLLSLTACESRIDRELREMEEAHNAISDLASNFGIELPEFGDTSGSITAEPDEDYQINTGYALLPVEILLNPETINRKHIGSRYYVPASTVEFYQDSTADGYYLLLYHDELTDEILDNDGWTPFFSLIITGTQTQEGWSEVEINENYIFYFEYSGYDESLGLHFGEYKSHSPYAPW